MWGEGVPLRSRLLVCHGGSLHVPERLIWAGAWHGRWVGSWHGHGGPNSGLSKTHRFNPDYAHHFSLSRSLHFPPLTSLPPSFPTHAFALFLSPAALSPAHASRFHRNLKAYPKTDAPHRLTCCRAVTSFLFVPLICSEGSLRIDKSLFLMSGLLFVSHLIV